MHVKFHVIIPDFDCFVISIVFAVEIEPQVYKGQ